MIWIIWGMLVFGLVSSYCVVLAQMGVLFMVLFMVFFMVIVLSFISIIDTMRGDIIWIVAVYLCRYMRLA
jgi:hypothetical protein